MTTATSSLSLNDLKPRIVEVEAELAILRGERLPAAQRAAALAYLGGRHSDETTSVRAQIRRVGELLAGLRALAEERECDEVQAELKKRVAAYEQEERRVERLRVNSYRPLEEGGNSFDEYADAANHLTEERHGIDALGRHFSELTGEPYSPLPPGRAKSL